MNKNVVVLDPGLKEFGGHHPAIIENLSKSNVDINLVVYANKQCDKALVQKLTNHHVSIKRYFDCDFYFNFYSNASLSFYGKYIRDLSKEYFNVLAEFDSEKTTFLHHTIDWNHAYALSLALALCKKREVNSSLHKHIVLLMFNPSTLGEVSEEKSDRAFNYSIGFSQLNRYNNVSLYAAEHELSHTYQLLLNAKIPRHPCGLLTNSQHQDIKIQRLKADNILLYVGDAKACKGFLSLPEVLHSFLTNVNFSRYIFTIHYTITNASSELKEVERSLNEIQKKSNRVVIKSDFLGENEMHHLWLSSSHIVFNYDENVYRNQSSGVLWLAAVYNVSIFFLTNTWLNREAKRLTCNIMDNEVFGLKSIENNIGKSEVYEVDSHKYKAQLFADLGSWLDKVIDTI